MLKTLFGCFFLINFTLMTYPNAQVLEDVVLEDKDLAANDNLLPTTYYIALESKTSCEGIYRGIAYNGSERSDVLTPDGLVLANVCTRFLKVLMMEGTGILSDRGLGPMTVNWAGAGRFLPMSICRMGLGVKGLCLLPHYTIAADLAQYSVGTMLYMPRARGTILPDGSVHQGFFLVRDTGGAFHGIGRSRVDLFVAYEDDSNNVFKARGFHHKKPEDSFVVSGESKKRALEFLREKFGPLYDHSTSN